MAVVRLEVTDFRNLASIQLEPITQGCNFLYGNNGSGKTSLLEAIYYLSLARSFRSSVMERVINHSADKFSLFAQVKTHFHHLIPIGVERHYSHEMKIRVSGKDTRSSAELARLVPVQLLNSQSFCLLDAPGFRRKYLDWGVFYQCQEFLPLWRQYERALRQRNAGLRSRLSRKELEGWTQELVQNALQMDQLRRNYLAHLFPLLLNTVSELLTIDDLKMRYQSGWSEGVDYQTMLNETIDRDFALGYTQHGPHRADLKITVKGSPAKDILSRGQQKLLVCAMILTQGALLHSSANRKPIYLVDDLPAELDLISRAKLMRQLAKQETQIFVTAVERDILNECLTDLATKVFHVEHGDITEVML